MQHVVQVVASVAHCPGVGKVSLAELDSLENRLKIFLRAGLEVIEHAHTFPLVDQRMSKMRPDKSRAAGNKVACQSANRCPVSLLLTIKDLTRISLQKICLRCR